MKSSRAVLQYNEWWPCESPQSSGGSCWWGQNARLGGCWGSGEIKASQRVYAVLSERKRQSGWQPRDTSHKQAGWELKVRRLGKNVCLAFPNVALPSFCLASFFFLGLSPGSSTVLRPSGNRRAALPASFLPGMSRRPGIAPPADFCLPLACTGLRCPGSSEAASMEGLGVEGSEWQGGTIIPVTDLSTRGSWAERVMSIYLSQGSDEGFGADGCIMQFDDVLSPSFLLLLISMY